MKKLGILLMLLGLLLVSGAGALVLHNGGEDLEAGTASAQLLTEVSDRLAEPGERPGEIRTEMTVKDVDGRPCIGVLSIPAIDRELPVLADWSYPELRVAPCRYVGSTFTDNLVIAAHNYRRHFGHIGQLRPGDDVYFTDMDGLTTAYSVLDTETLMGTDVEGMVESDADLSLFTCTYGGRSRITVRCERVH